MQRRLPACLAALLQAAALAAHAADAPQKGGFTLTKLEVDASKIVEGGPGKDGIHSVDAPKFVELPEAPWLGLETEVLGLQVGDEARAYPVRMLEYHQIVNDVIGDKPVAVTYDPLAGTPVAFSRKVGGRTLTFGVSGLLYNDNFLMFDRETNSLWSQFLGKAIAGPLAGQRLERLPLRQETAVAWVKRAGGTQVLVHPDPEHVPYIESPYSAYWLQDKVLFPVAAQDDRYHAKELVLGVVVDGKARAYLGSILTRDGNADERIGGKRVQVRYSSDTGTFDWDVDEGVEVAEAYWLAWKAFHPDTEIWHDDAKKPTPKEKK
jgi:hypothetical protein